MSESVIISVRPVMSKAILETLNPAQREAVIYTDGPILVLAGAGSGKTKVITHRFAHLIAKKSLPKNILTVTFTNKAAAEMKERISRLVKKDMDGAWVGTFHSQCSRILRREIHALGYGNNFSIANDDDQSSLIKHILKEFKMYEALFKGISARISLLKASLIGPEEFMSNGDVFGFEDKFSRVYFRYKDELKKCNALDFDDLIMLTIKLFEEHPGILKKYHNMFHHVLVDEFQDINYAQYRLIKLLAEDHRMICAVGDDDQSIYSFRGADHSSIMNFEKDFKGAKIIKLEQNYRSTLNILSASGSVIKTNALRHPKTLRTDRKGGEKIWSCHFNTEQEESQYISRVIREMYLKGMYSYKDFAILYRINIQSRPLEEMLRTERIPYHIVGGTGFYQRREIKDLSAYLKLAVNPNNNVSLRRIINCPPRGIGASTLSKLEQMAKKKSISLFTAIKEALKTNNITVSIKEKLDGFIKLIEAVSPEKFKDASEMLLYITKGTGYEDYIDEDRAANVVEFITSSEGMDIKEFIDKVALFTNIDDINSVDSVALMTLHAAKGLEFPVVFIAGVEEGILPYFKAQLDKDIAEERRLLYVGMTRAKDMLWLTTARKRRVYSKIQEQQQSRFLKDIPCECCQKIEKILPPAVVPIRDGALKTFKPILFSIGSRVRHPKWGVGVIRDSDGAGDDQKVTVNFPAIGIKRLALKFAHIERI